MPLTTCCIHPWWYYSKVQLHFFKKKFLKWWKKRFVLYLKIFLLQLNESHCNSCLKIIRYTAQKMKSSIKDFFSKWDQKMFPADLVIFTEEILSGKLHFLCSDNNWLNLCFRTKFKLLNKFSIYDTPSDLLKVYSAITSTPSPINIFERRAKRKN